MKKQVDLVFKTVYRVTIHVCISQWCNIQMLFTNLDQKNDCIYEFVTNRFGKHERYTHKHIVNQLMNWLHFQLDDHPVYII